ncbi:cytochrome P450 2J2-like isoform X3 [Dendrobates tinctorius]|uniref:cytochrome P450 2J2-like isoform X3 n=1 Tax=Dendrobates tinctorius TaxID=92724 RepID=UPI003CC94B58
MAVIWVLLVLLLGLFSIQFMKLRQAAALLPPGPTPLPLIGNLFTIKFQLHHRTLMKLSEIYGNIMTIWVGQTPLIVVSGYETVKHCLIDNSEQVSNRPTTPYFKYYAENQGIIFSNGHNWKLQRRLGLKILRNLGFGKKGLEWRIKKEACHLVEVFVSQKGSATDPNSCIMNAVSNVMTAVNFGHTYSLKDKFFHHIIDSSDVVGNFYGTHWGQVKDDPASTISEGNLVRVLMDLLLAGSETVTSTLKWGLLYMAIYQDVQVKVQKEIDAFVESIENLQYEDRIKMPYTNAVIHEVQRFSNVAPVGLPRQCTQDIKLNEYSIRKGSIVIANLASVLTEPKHWKFPDTFNPSNFLDEEENFQSNKAFVPFSAGHRICMGEQMARTELFIFFTSLLKTLSFHLPKGVTEVNLNGIFGTTFKPHPYQICAIPR